MATTSTPPAARAPSPAPQPTRTHQQTHRLTQPLFTAPLAGRDAFVYVLVEHQSSDDPLMAFRVLRYVTRIWDQYEREHPGTLSL